MKIERSTSVALTVAVAFFMQGLDTTAINTAVPAMARSFGTDVTNLSAGITSYLIALAIFIPVSGWIAERYGARKVFCTSIVLFILSSLLCGTSQTLTQFVMYRILQGMAGAMMTPVGRLAVLKIAPKENLVSVMSYITWPALIAPIIGPAIGGYLTTYWSWHWIFLLNIPISIVCMAMALRFMPGDESDHKVDRRFDAVGFVLSGLALAGFMYGLEMLSHQGVSYYLALAVIVASASLLLFNVRYSRHISNPLIDYSIMRVHTYRVTIFTGTLSRMVIGVAPFLVPLMFQEGFGLSPFESGMLFLSTMVGNFCMKPLAVWVLHRYRFRSVLIANGLVVVVFTVLTALLLPTTPIWITVTVMFLSGMFRSMQYSAITTLAFADVSKEQLTPANTLYSTVQQMSSGMGIAIGAVFLRLSKHINHTGDGYSVADFRMAFIFVAILGLVSLYGFTKLPASAGDAVRTKKK